MGHRIIEINGQSVVATAHEKIVQALSNSVGEVRLCRLHPYCHNHFSEARTGIEGHLGPYICKPASNPGGGGGVRCSGRPLVPTLGNQPFSGEPDPAETTAQDGAGKPQLVCVLPP